MLEFVVSLALPVAVLALFALGPGLWLGLRLRAAGPLRLAVVIGLGLLVAYLQGLAGFLLGLPQPGHDLLLLCWGALLFLQRRRVQRLLRPQQGVLALWLALLLWSAGWLLQVHQYSGGGWAGDWLEHYQRTLVFLGQLDPGHRFLTVYDLPARPPLMNVVAAVLAGYEGADFPAIASIYLVLNSLPALVLLPMARALTPARQRRRAPALLAILLATQPLWVENTTYLWTKLFAAFWVLLAAWLFASWLAWPRPRLLLLVALLLGAGVLTHYSAAVFVVVVAAVALWHGLRRAPLRRALGPSALAGGALLATWFAWSIARFGLRVTLLSNTSVTDNPAHGAAALAAKWLSNLYSTLVPHVLRGVGVDAFGQQHPLAELRDHVFLLTQTNLLPSVGLIGGLVLILVLRQRWSLPPRRPALRRFWVLLVVVGVLLGVAVHGAPDAYGLTHICLQPVVLLGLAALAAGAFALPRPWQAALLLGLVLNAALGLILHFWLQGLPSLIVPLGHGRRAVVMADWLVSATAAANAKLKAAAGVTFWQDRMPELSPVLLWSMGAGSAVLIALAAWLLLASPATRRASRSATDTGAAAT